MTVSEKIKTIKTKSDQKKLNIIQTDKQLKFQLYHQENIGKYEFLTGKDVLLEKYLLEKAATTKRFQHSPLGSELKKQVDIAKKKQENK